MSLTLPDRDRIKLFEIEFSPAFLLMLGQGTYRVEENPIPDDAVPISVEVVRHPGKPALDSVIVKYATNADIEENPGSPVIRRLAAR